MIPSLFKIKILALRRIYDTKCIRVKFMEINLFSKQVIFQLYPKYYSSPNYKIIQKHSN